MLRFSDGVFPLNCPLWLTAKPARRLGRFLLTASLALVLHPAVAEDAVSPGVGEPSKPRAQSELIVEGLASYGNYRLFGGAESTKLYAAGVEYDREVWPRFLGARVDYAAEFLPVLILSQPAKTDIWGSPQSRARTVIPGVGITPLGFRLLWREERRWMPYFEPKGSVFGFTRKALSSQSTYENWSFNLTSGFKARLTDRFDLRVGLLSDLHFSNGFVVRVNPAVDLMNVSVGVVYHLGRRPRLHWFGSEPGADHDEGAIK